MHKGLFIVGSEPRAGKTVVARALAAATRHLGRRVAAVKPIETGCAPIRATQGSSPPSELDPAVLDALTRLTELAGPPPAAALARLPPAALHPSDDALLRASARCTAGGELACPYRFAPPLEPVVAARLAEVEIDLELIQRCCTELANGHDLVIIEGWGGLLAPLTPRHLQVDLIERLGFPVLLVAPLAAGTISHCLLALEVLRSRSLPVAGVVLRRTDREHRPEEAAQPLEIERFAGPLVRGVLPCFTAEELQDVEHLGRRLAVHVDLAATLAL
jgi:dethiobiotin synthetase